LLVKVSGTPTGRRTDTAVRAYFAKGLFAKRKHTAHRRRRAGHGSEALPILSGSFPVSSTKSRTLDVPRRSLEGSPPLRAGHERRRYAKELGGYESAFAPVDSWRPRWGQFLMAADIS
jgi:hypothetical protein